MAAGQGFKTFVTGEVLTSGDVNGYLMQGINVFTNATARDAAITAPAEGQFAFTKDNNSLWYYDGAAWVASGATGDIEGVTAGVGISGGGTSGTVTVTNSMATAIDAKGDLVPGTGADTFARLAVGANGTVLTADSAEATGLKWAATSSGAVVQVKSATYSTAVSTTGSTMIDTNLSVTITPTSASNKILVFVSQQMQGESSATYPEPAVNLELFRDSTSIWNAGQYGFYFFKFASGTTDVRNIVNINYLDSPATTSATVYKTKFAIGAANVTARVQAQGSTSTITVMEVTP